MEFDTDPDAAADTRRRVFDMVATATGWRSPACTCTFRGSHVFHFAFLGFARFFAYTGQFGGFFLLKTGLLLAQIHFTSLPNVRRFYFSARCVPDIHASNNAFLRAQIFFVLFALGIHGN
jgi:hypothetical protein